MANVLDRVVGYFNPHEGLRRYRARQLLERAYEGASKADGWRPKRGGASANTDHAHDAAELRRRSRSLIQNVPYMAAGLRGLVAATVGTGIMPRWMGPNADTFDRLWAEHAPYADADGRTDVYGLQALAYRAMEQDGEVLVRLRHRRVPGSSVPLQFQLLEIDWLDSSRTERHGSNAIVNGIEYDAQGLPAYYWLFDQHPGEQLVTSVRGRSSSPVPARDIIHLYSPERPGQGRGFPRAAPVIVRVRDLQLYEDSEQQRKNLESRLGVLASGDATLLANRPSDIAIPADGASAASSDLGQLPSGGITALPAGVNITTLEPRVAPGYVEYVKNQLHLIAAGWGVPYELMTHDLSQVNYSSIRGGELNFRRAVEMTQWLTLIPRGIDRMCRAFADVCATAGLVPKPSYTIDYSTPKWDYVNPQQDVQADLDEVSGGLSSLSEKLRRRGYKPDQVYSEIATDMERLRDLGLLDVLPFYRPKQTGVARDGTPEK